MLDNREIRIIVDSLIASTNKIADALEQSVKLQQRADALVGMYGKLIADVGLTDDKFVSYLKKLFDEAIKSQEEDYKTRFALEIENDALKKQCVSLKEELESVYADLGMHINDNDEEDD